MRIDLAELVTWAKHGDPFDKVEQHICEGYHEDWSSLPVVSKYLQLPTVQNWLLNSAWIRSASTLGEGKAVMRHVLRRHLLNLQTRMDTTKLEDFWRFAVTCVDGPPEVLDLWSSYRDRLRGTFVSLRESSVREQEDAFSMLLREISKQVGTHRSMRWASATLRAIADERSPQNSVKESRIRVVFAWKPRIARLPTFRPGLLLSFTLGHKAGQRGIRGTDWLSTPPEDGPVEATKSLFDETFSEAMVSLAASRGHWYPIHFSRKQVLPSPRNIFTGGSFALAIGVAQELANIDAFYQFHSVLRPYVVISAAADANNLNVSGPVEHINEKVELLLEEGVRAIVVATEQRDLQIPDWASGNIDVIYTDGPEKQTAKALRKDYAQVAKLEGDFRPWWPPSRRDCLVAIAGAVPIAAGIGWSGARIQEYVTRPKPTRSLTAHGRSLREFESMLTTVDRIRRESKGMTLPSLMKVIPELTTSKRFVNVTVPVVLNRVLSPFRRRRRVRRRDVMPAGYEDAMQLDLTSDLRNKLEEVERADDPALACSTLFPEETSQLIGEVADRFQISASEISVAQKPDDLKLSNFRVEYDSKCFDNSHWVNLREHFKDRKETTRSFFEDRIKDTPVEPALMTRCVGLTCKADRVIDEKQTVAFEFSSSGFGVIPLPNEGDEVSIYLTQMDESAAFEKRTVTTVIRRPLSKCDCISKGERYSATIQSIYYNSWQDQTVRGKDTDWWGTRVKSDARAADFAIAFPPGLEIQPHEQRRGEAASWKYVPYKVRTEGITREPNGSYYHEWNQRKLYVVSLVVDDDLPNTEGSWIYRISGKWQRTRV